MSWWVWLLIAWLLASPVVCVAAGKWLARREQQPFDPDKWWTP